MLIRTQRGAYVPSEKVLFYRADDCNQVAAILCGSPKRMAGELLGIYSTPDAAQSALDALAVALILAKDRIGFGYYDMAEGAFVKVGDREIKTTC
jgi:hypothetical protein